MPLHHPRLPRPVGGLFRHVIDLVRGQIARGHRVGIVADSSTGNARADEIFAELAPQLALGLTRIPMRRPLSPLDLPPSCMSPSAFAKTDADVIHGHGAKGGAYARLAIPGRAWCAPIRHMAAACCSVTAIGRAACISRSSASC